MRIGLWIARIRNSSGGILTMCDGIVKRKLQISYTNMSYPSITGMRQISCVCRLLPLHSACACRYTHSRGGMRTSRVQNATTTSKMHDHGTLSTIEGWTSYKPEIRHLDSRVSAGFQLSQQGCAGPKLHSWTVMSGRVQTYLSLYLYMDNLKICPLK